MIAPGSARDSWRLIVDPPAGGAWNMAVDEALLDSYARSEAEPPPTLRLYGWAPGALSLGRHQGAPPRVARDFLRAEALDLVRRPTGGKAVLHEHERTYAVIGLLRQDPFACGVLETYERIAGALAGALGALGLSVRLAASDTAAGGPDAGSPACFAAPSAREILSGGEKLVGSAQLRRRGAFLQHGSMPLRVDAGRLSRAVGDEEQVEGFTDLERVAGHPLSVAALDLAVVASFERAFSTSLVPGGLEPAEALLATRLRCWKYLSAAWTLNGWDRSRLSER